DGRLGSPIPLAHRRAVRLGLRGEVGVPEVSQRGLSTGQRRLDRHPHQRVARVILGHGVQRLLPLEPRPRIPYLPGRIGMTRYPNACLESAEGRWPAEDHSQPPRSDRPLTIRVFQNPVLEWISRAHPITPIIWYGPFIAWSWVDGILGRGFVRTLELFLA